MIASLVSDAAPGEIDAVRRDIEVFSGGNNSVKTQLADAVRRANVDQLRVVEVGESLTVLSKHNQLSDAVFFTHGPKPVEFSIDHLTRKTKVVGPHEHDNDVVDSTQLASLQKQVDAYAKQHYAGEFVSAVFPKTSSGGEYAVIVVGRRLNPQNFHNGQISAEYDFHAESGKLRGVISADVHFFEDGNVRLKSSYPVNHEASGGGSGSSLGAALKEVENAFEAGLNKTLVGLNEREFKSLRRQLPVTRQPMVWSQTVNYKLGKELERR